MSHLFAASFCLTFIAINGDVHCNNPPPGFDRMQMGIDIADFDQFAKQPGFLTLPVIDVTCNLNYTWTHPINHQVYDIPDQLTTNPVALPYDVTDYLSLVELTTYGLELNIAASISESYAFGLFSKSTSISNSFDYLSEQKRFVAAVNSTTQAFRMNIWPYDLEPDLTKLSPQAQSYINTLPPIFDSSTVHVYDKFLTNWGTHYCTETFTGGYFRCEYYTSESFIGVMDKAEIEYQAGLYFMGFLQKSGAVAATIAPAAAAFKQATLFNCHCSPSCPDSQSSYEQWQTEATYYPWLISLKYAPVTDLITNTTIRANMKVATANHLAHSYLQYEVLPALSIFAIAIKNAVILQGDSNCPAPANFIIGTCTTGNCNLNHFYTTETGSPFNDIYNKVKQQQIAVNSSIYSMMSQANSMLQESIINVTQLNQFGTQFISTTNIMESGISVKQCQINAPYDGCIQELVIPTCCVCNSITACGCPTKVVTNKLTYLTGLYTP
eukprot:325557_1